MDTSMYSALNSIDTIKNRYSMIFGPQKIVRPSTAFAIFFGVESHFNVSLDTKFAYTDYKTTESGKTRSEFANFLITKYF